MSTLFIGKRFYTNRDALKDQFGRIYQLPRFWAETGMEVNLWLIDYHTKERMSEHHQSLRIHSLPVFSLHSLRHLLTSLRRRPRNVIASGDCYIGLLGYMIARLSGAGFTFDIYDKYTTFPGYRKIIGIDPFKFLVKNSDHLLFASTVLAAETTPYQSRKATFSIAPNGIDSKIFYPRYRTHCRKTLGLDTHSLYVGYFGSMEPDRGLTDLLTAIRYLRLSGLEIRLLLAGNKSANLNISDDWVDYLGNIPHTKVAIALCCCNVLSLPYRNSDFLDMASSCKIAEYLAVQIPIAATRTPNLIQNFPTQALQLENVLAAPNDPTSLAMSIAQQLMAPVLASTPLEMDWQHIAERILRELPVR
ncbi:hypothetical protein DK254_00535 [Pseudomonas sp. RW407]|uniref:glycosyltransferase n=1 Tax=Pseudomonas sp. RW407 TaxID=2202894 RepID=UPI000D6ED80F|nr:glycosyltransferase [Pseudomonas sp. RW407]PWU29230.1 hypothetical protein DK254_13860 [Pseudomonas sp. RW407]PWU32102.1 hypothetical protein DK254_00535 [Pseudomonas sp. RW407]